MERQLQKVTAYQEVWGTKGCSVGGAVKGWAQRVQLAPSWKQSCLQGAGRRVGHLLSMKTANMSHDNNYSKHTQICLGEDFWWKWIRCYVRHWCDHLYSSETRFEWNKYREGLLGWSWEGTGSKQCLFLCWQLCLTRVLWSSPQEQGMCCGSWARQCTRHRKWLSTSRLNLTLELRSMQETSQFV